MRRRQTGMCTPGRISTTGRAASAERYRCDSGADYGNQTDQKDRRRSETLRECRIAFGLILVVAVTVHPKTQETVGLCYDKKDECTCHMLYDGLGSASLAAAPPPALQSKNLRSHTTPERSDSADCRLRPSTAGDANCAVGHSLSTRLARSCMLTASSGFRSAAACCSQTWRAALSVGSRTRRMRTASWPWPRSR